MMTLAQFLRGSQEISISTTTSLVPGGPYVNVVAATTTGLRVRLPDATKLRLGRGQRWIANNGSNAFTVRDGANVDLLTLNPGDCADFHLLAQASAAGVWKWEQRTIGSAASPGLALLGYLIGGTNTASPSQSKKTTEWNPQFGIFTTKTDSTLGWTNAASFVIGAHGYIMAPLGGGATSQQVEQYDPDVHTVKGLMPNTLATSGFGCGCTISGFGFFTGGQNLVVGAGMVGQYTEGTDSWATLAQRPVNSRGAAEGWVSLTAGTGVAFGSFGGGSAGVAPNNRTDVYTAAGDSWAQKTTRPGPTTGRFASANLNGLGFTFGGDFATMPTAIADTYQYDQGADVWTSRPSNPNGAGTGRNVVPILNQAYLLGGSVGSVSSGGLVDSNVYDPLALTWTVQTSLPHDRGAWANHGMPIAV